MPKRLTTEEFILKAKRVHNNKFDYDKAEYVNANTKVCIICPEHGEFWQRPNKHLFGDGCRKCFNDKVAKRLTCSNNEFIEKSKSIHGNKYDYSKVEYVNGRTKVTIICSEHNEFIQTPENHLMGKGCSRCKGFCKNTTDIINEFVNIHGGVYDYSKVDYITATTKVTIICPKHGEFKQQPSSHLSGRGCPRCNESHGERAIRTYLDEHNIIYKSQHTFSECKHIKPLQFDFYIPEHNLLIEYDGKQHFEPVSYFGGCVKFEEQQRNDNIKNNFVKNNEFLSMLRIPYTDIHNIDRILSTNLHY